jgi:hypothetical protein
VATSNGVTVCAASFHLPSVSTANTNTVKYPTPHQQYKLPTILAVVISKDLIPQSNIMTGFVHSHSNILSDVSPVSPTNIKLQHTVVFIMAISCSSTCLVCPNIKIQNYTLFT